MENLRFVEQLLKPYGPTIPISSLVGEMNRLYHSFEASGYDSAHPEIHLQLPPLWSSMIQVITAKLPAMEWDVLDFGCGTGFASRQILANVNSRQLRSLTCYDPSPEMTNLCRSRLSDTRSFVSAFSDLSQLSATRRRFNVLITNSVLHHLPNPREMLDSIGELLTPDAVWLCGHEPSRRYYENPACVELLCRYRKKSQWMRFLQPKAYMSRLSRFLRIHTDPASSAAKMAHRNGLFERRPSRLAVSRLVDFHVAHSPGEAKCGRGFDIQQLKGLIRDEWALEWHHSYNFLGPFWQGYAASVWQERCEQLRSEFPEDGANFCSVWSRRASVANAA